MKTLLQSCGLSFSSQINYISLLPTEHAMYTLYSESHLNRLDGLIKPWFIIALFICLASTGFALFKVPGTLFVSVRALVDVITILIWWSVSKRSKYACFVMVPLNYFFHFLGMVLIQVAFFSEAF